MNDGPAISNRVAEMAVLGSMMLDPSLDDSRLTSDAFTFADTRQMFTTILAMREEQGLTSDTVAVFSELQRRGWTEEFGGIEAVQQFLATPGDLVNFDYYSRILLNLQTQRGAAAEITTIARTVMQTGCDLAELRSRLTTLTESLTPFEATGFITAAELLQEHSTLSPAVIHGLQRAGEIAGLIGCTKSQKSWAVMQLAVAGALGQKWLGTFDVERGHVLLIDGELRKPLLANRLKSVCDAMGVQTSWVANNITFRAARGERSDILTLLAEARRMRPAPHLVIIDPLFKLLPDGVDENSNGDMARLWAAIDATAERLGCAIVIVHHASKGAQDGKRLTDIGSGAGASSRSVDAHLVLREHAEDGCATFDAALRSFAPIDPMVLRWSFPLWTPDESLDPANLKRARPGDAAQEAKDRDGIEEVVAAVKDGHVTERAIRDALHTGAPRAQRLISKASKAGRIKVVETVNFRGKDIPHFGVV